MAYHEVGHALVTALQKNSEPVQKITIVPRTMGALGYVMQVPEEEKYLMSQEEMINRITTCLGGRAAEKIIFNSITTGASNDIEQATKLARAMVTQYGMSDKFGMIGLESIENKYLDGRTVLNCSDSTAAEVDHEVMRILKECYDVAEQQLQENIEVLHKIAEFLIQKETVTGKEFMRIYRQIKGIEEPEEEEKPEQRYSVQSRNVPLKDNGNQNPQPQSHPRFSNAPLMPNFPHPDVRNGQGMPAENEKGQQRVTSEPVRNQQVLSQKAENGQQQMEAENRED